MRKRIINEAAPSKATETHGDWLDLEAVADVELSSENPEHPIENALLPGRVAGWRAATPGKQTIRLRFQTPQHLERIWLQFEETEQARTQEFLLRWSPDDGRSVREIVRQQWNFSPEGAPVEREDIALDAAGATWLELVIIPDIQGGDALASLAQLRVAARAPALD